MATVLSYLILEVVNFEAVHPLEDILEDGGPQVLLLDPVDASLTLH